MVTRTKKTKARTKALREFTREGYHVRTPKVREDFLTHISNGASIQLAADLVGHSRTAIYKWLREDPEFRAEYDQASEGANDRVDDEVWRRGVRGVRKAVFHQGRIVAYERVYSDRLLELRAKRSGRYRDAEGGVTVNLTQNTLMTLTEEELHAEMRKRGLPIVLLEE